jgi:hypothetical protein
VQHTGGLVSQNGFWDGTMKFPADDCWDEAELARERARHGAGDAVPLSVIANAVEQLLRPLFVQVRHWSKQRDGMIRQGS